METGKRAVVTLLTDFGLADPYVAEMKAVILSTCPNVTLVDITHDIPKYDVRMGAYILARSAKFFPKGTAHVAVVDPGVGGPRKPLVVETDLAFLVGPDNGILMLAADRLGLKHVYQIENERYIMPKVSATFHGRDVFAPVAGHMAAGVPPSAFGRELFHWEKPSFAESKVADNRIVGEVIHIDSFGNLVTNIDGRLFQTQGVTFDSDVRVALNTARVLDLKFLETYSKSPEGALLVTVGSEGFVEISANKANASMILKARRGMKVEVMISGFVGFG